MRNPFVKPVMLGELQTQVLEPFFPADVHLPETAGGTAVSNLVHARLQRGLQTDVITLDPQAELLSQCFRSDLVNLWILRRRSSRCVRDGYKQERGLIEAALADSDADICHAHWTYEYGFSAVRQKIKPYVVTVHDHARNILRWVGQPYLGQYLITQYVFRKAAGRLTAVSPYIAEYVSRITKHRVPVIANVVPLLEEMSEDRGQRTVDRGQGLETEDGQTTVLTVADAGRLKNVKRGIEAFQLFRGNRNDVRYLLVGHGLDADGDVAQWAKVHALSACVEFMGWMPNGEILNIMRSASAVLHPSLEESFGNPVAEAMALGVPVIGADEAGGVRWLLAEDSGWLVSGSSVKTLAKALSDALEQRDRSRNKIENAFQRIKALCDSERILAQYDEVYAGMMGDIGARVRESD